MTSFYVLLNKVVYQKAFTFPLKQNSSDSNNFEANLLIKQPMLLQEESQKPHPQLLRTHIPLKPFEERVESMNS